MRAPPAYDMEKLVWHGPALPEGIFDVPYGERLLNELQKHGDKLFQVRNAHCSY